jgi:ribonuclease VapC
VIVDTSALVAIFFEEPEAEEFIELILRTEFCRLSVVSHLELMMVVEGAGKPETVRRAIAFLNGAGIIEEPVSLHQGQLARMAFHEFGRGRHRAKLNFGDCFAYALAKAMDEPLLFKGIDFSRTDVRPARRS